MKAIDAVVYHYGWVKEPKIMQRKQEVFPKLWHDDNWVDKNVKISEAFDYAAVDALKRFEETHPAVMIPGIKRKNWKFEYDMSSIICLFATD